VKAYKFKLKVSKKVREKLEETVLLCRELYNSALQERSNAFKIAHKSLNYFDQASQLTEIKQIRDEFQNVHSQVLQDVLKRLDKTFRFFFTRVKLGEKSGFPRFKGQERYNSFTFPQANGAFRLEGNNLFLSKIGKIKVRLSQNVIGKVKTCTIKKEVTGWYVILIAETEKQLLEKTGQSIGIDAGIENFLTLSNGEKIKNFRYFENSQNNLRVLQRSFSRKKKDSNSRRKVVIQLRKAHQKIRNQRNDFAHKVSTRLIKEFDVIAIENLNIRAMSKGFLSKQVYDVGWSHFYKKLEYKAEEAGKKLIKVNPKGTSQTCICGIRVQKTLAQRTHQCPSCGYENHRDIVSAKVILQRAVGQTVETPTYAIEQSVVSESTVMPVSV